MWLVSSWTVRDTGTMPCVDYSYTAQTGEQQTLPESYGWSTEQIPSQPLEWTYPANIFISESGFQNWEPNACLWLSPSLWYLVAAAREYEHHQTPGYANSEEQAVPYSQPISWGHEVARLGGLTQKLKWLWREEKGVSLRLATSAHSVYITVLLGLSSTASPT